MTQAPTVFAIKLSWSRQLARAPHQRFTFSHFGLKTKTDSYKRPLAIKRNEGNVQLNSSVVPIF